MEIGGLGSQGGLVTWVLDLDTQINFCCFLSPLLLFFKLQAPPSGWMENDHWVFLFFPFTPLSSPSGEPWDVLVPPLVVRCDSGVHSARNWLQLVQLCWFSLVSHAEQNRVFAVQRDIPRKLLQNKNPSINKGLEWKAQLQIIPDTFHNDSV